MAKAQLEIQEQAGPWRRRSLHTKGFTRRFQVAHARAEATGSSTSSEQASDTSISRRTTLAAALTGVTSGVTALAGQSVLRNTSRTRTGLSLDEQNTVDVFNASTPSVVFITNLQVHSLAVLPFLRRPFHSVIVTRIHGRPFCFHNHCEYGSGSTRHVHNG